MPSASSGPIQGLIADPDDLYVTVAAPHSHRVFARVSSEGPFIGFVEEPALAEWVRVTVPQQASDASAAPFGSLPVPITVAASGVSPGQYLATVRFQATATAAGQVPDPSDPRFQDTVRVHITVIAPGLRVSPQVLDHFVPMDSVGQVQVALSTSGSVPVRWAVSTRPVNGPRSLPSHPGTLDTFSQYRHFVDVWTSQHGAGSRPPPPTAPQVYTLDAFSTGPIFLSVNVTGMQKGVYGMFLDVQDTAGSVAAAQVLWIVRVGLVSACSSELFVSLEPGQLAPVSVRLTAHTTPFPFTVHADPLSRIPLQSPASVADDDQNSEGSAFASAVAPHAPLSVQASQSPNMTYAAAPWLRLPHGNGWVLPGGGTFDVAGWVDASRMTEGPGLYRSSFQVLAKPDVSGQAGMGPRQQANDSFVIVLTVQLLPGAARARSSSLVTAGTPSGSGGVSSLHAKETMVFDVHLADEAGFPRVHNASTLTVSARHWAAGASATEGRELDAGAVSVNALPTANTSVVQVLVEPPAPGVLQLVPAVPSRLSHPQQEPVSSPLQFSSSQGVAALQGGFVTLLPALCSGAGQQPAPGGVRCSCMPGWAPPTGLALARGADGASACVQCAAGYFSEGGLGSSCQRCPSGMFSYAGASSCEACPAQGVLCVDGVVQVQSGFYAPQGVNVTRLRAGDTLLPCLHPEACVSLQLLLDELEELEQASLPVALSRQLQAAESNSTLSGRIVELRVALGAMDPVSAGESSQAQAFTCTKGYTGPLCGVCAEGYAFSGNECVKCWEGSSSALATTVAMLLMLAFVVRQGFASCAPRPGNSSMVLVRIAVSWMQVSGMMAAFSLTIPSQAATLLQLIGGASDGLSLSLFPAQCALRLGFYERFYVTLLTPVATSAVIVAIGFALSAAGCCKTWCAREGTSAVTAATAKAPEDSGVHQGIEMSALNPLSSARRIAGPSKSEVLKHIDHGDEDDHPVAETDAANDSRPRSFSRWLQGSRKQTSDEEAGEVVAVAPESITPVTVSLGAALSLLFFMYPAVAKASMSVLDVFPDPIGGVMYLRSDLSVRTDTPEYETALGLAIVFIILYVVGLPLVSVGVLWHFRSLLHTAAMRRRLAVLYDGYDLYGLRFLWELVKFLEKASMAFLAVMVRNAQLQLSVGVGLMLVGLLLHISFRPYATGEANSFETVALLLVVTTLLGLGMLDAGIDTVSWNNNTSDRWRRALVAAAGEPSDVQEQSALTEATHPASRANGLTIGLVLLNGAFLISILLAIAAKASPALARALREVAHQGRNAVEWVESVVDAAIAGCLPQGDVGGSLAQRSTGLAGADGSAAEGPVRGAKPEPVLAAQGAGAARDLTSSMKRRTRFSVAMLFTRLNKSAAMPATRRGSLFELEDDVRSVRNPAGPASVFSKRPNERAAFSATKISRQGPGSRGMVLDDEEELQSERQATAMELAASQAARTPSSRVVGFGLEGQRAQAMASAKGRAAFGLGGRPASLSRKKSGGGDPRQARSVLRHKQPAAAAPQPTAPERAAVVSAPRKAAPPPVGFARRAVPPQVGGRRSLAPEEDAPAAASTHTESPLAGALRSVRQSFVGLGSMFRSQASPTAASEPAEPISGAEEAATSDSQSSDGDVGSDIDGELSEQETLQDGAQV